MKFFQSLRQVNQFVENRGPGIIRYNKNDSFSLAVADMISDADDWEIYVEPLHDEFL